MARATKATRILTNIATTLSRNTLAPPLHFLFLGEPEEEGTARRREEDHVASDPHGRAAHALIGQPIETEAGRVDNVRVAGIEGARGERETPSEDHVLDHVDRERNRGVRVDR